MFKLAMVQMRIDGGNKSQNLNHAVNLIEEAVINDANVVLLPEAMNLGWTHPAAKTEADRIPDGQSCRMLIDAAKRNHIYLCSGLVEKKEEKVFNTAILINPDGKVILLHRKLNELDIGHQYYDQGDRLNVCHTEFGTIGLMICSDAFAEDKVLSKSLGYMGADVILSPCSWAVPPDYDNIKDPCGRRWFDHYHLVAKKFSLWIAGVSNVGPINSGPWKGFNCIGNSLLINHEGKIVVEAPYGHDAETISYAQIRPVKRPARGCDWVNYWESN
jgi:predicted amidohydrolase